MLVVNDTPCPSNHDAINVVIKAKQISDVLVKNFGIGCAISVIF